MDETGGAGGSKDAGGKGGAAGAAGSSAGAAGAAGTSGSAGAAGAAGAGGSSGNAGAAGSAGASGNAGAAGSAGASGTSGSSGSAGAAGASGNAGAAGTAGTTGIGGAAGSAGSGGACIEADQEPDDTEDTAIARPDAKDCDGTGSSFAGTLENAADQDWFKFHGDDQIGCDVNPTFEAVASGTLVVCAYFECDSGTTNVKCGSAAQGSTSALGKTGCCSSTKFTTEVNCSGTLEDSSTVYVQVKSASNNAACLGYVLDYHY